MRLAVLLSLVATLCLGGNVLAAETAKAPSPAQAAQRQKVTDCNQQATTQNLKGDERKTFMSHCLKAESKTPDKAMSTQQSKMKSCNADASKKNLKGDARTTFMSQCLKKAA